jgi:hypothetical protein
MPTTLNVTEMLPTRFEPLRKGRFILEIEGIDSFLVKTAARPSINIEEVAIPWMGSTRYVSGKATFGTLAITLHDAIAPSGAQQVMEWVRLHYESVSGRSGYADFYKRDIVLKMLDPVGTVVQLWDIKGAQITAVEGGDLSYEGSELAQISLTIRFDNCVMQF